MQGKVFPLNPESGSSSRERHRILVAILDFAEEAENAKNIYLANLSGPICILQILRNNPNRGVWVFMNSENKGEQAKTNLYMKIHGIKYL